MTFEDRPRAKVNLTLQVLGRRPDGYHELRSVFLRVGLSDRLSVRPGSGPKDQLVVTGLPGAPTRENLVMRAMEAVRARAELPLPGLDVVLEKRIPLVAGLGGGSSDCASAIKLAQVAWGIALSASEEMSLAASLGSDVPFFVCGAEMALVEGRGERVSPMRPMGNAGLLTLTPELQLSTARVFQRYDDVGGESPSDFSTDLLAFTDLRSAASRLRDSNDLWPAAVSLAPELENLRDHLETTTRRAWMMSGSGPTLFALYSSVAEAADDGRRLAGEGPAIVATARMNAVDVHGFDPAWRYP